jgi:hypothetical protein
LSLWSWVQSLWQKKTLTPARIRKIGQLAANPFAQPEVRMQNMTLLIDDGQPLALQAVLRRFTCNAQVSIVDEEEKQWLENALVKVGEGAIEPLRAYIAQDQKLTYALSALRRIEGDACALGYFIEILEKYGPEDHRGCEAKVQLLDQLMDDYQNHITQEHVLPFLFDHSDEVCWAVLSLVERVLSEHCLAEPLRIPLEESLLKLMAEKLSKARIARRAEILAQQLLGKKATKTRHCVAK